MRVGAAIIALLCFFASGARSPAQQSPHDLYDALNAAPGKDVPKLLMQATAPNWVSCGGNDACGTREQVIATSGRMWLLNNTVWLAWYCPRMRSNPGCWQF